MGDAQQFGFMVCALHTTSYPAYDERKEIVQAPEWVYDIETAMVGVDLMRTAKAAFDDPYGPPGPLSAGKLVAVFELLGAPDNPGPYIPKYVPYTAVPYAMRCQPDGSLVKTGPDEISMRQLLGGD